MSAELVGWKLMCDGCGASYGVNTTLSLERARGAARLVGWWADDPDVRPEHRRDFCPSCKFRHREGRHE